MSANDSLLEFCETWRSLTLMERNAIQSGSWAAVKAAQEQKHTLREKCAISAEALGCAHRVGFRPMIEEIMHLERANAELLAQRKEETGSRLAQLTGVARNLRHVHRAYTSQGRGFWASYS